MTTCSIHENKTTTGTTRTINNRNKLARKEMVAG
jgi:hypothetical protein